MDRGLGMQPSGDPVLEGREELSVGPLAQTIAGWSEIPRPQRDVVIQIALHMFLFFLRGAVYCVELW